MFRINVVALLVGLLGTVALVAVVLSQSASSGLLVDLEERVKSAGESVRLADALHDHTLVMATTAVAAAPDVVAGIQCPATEEGLRAATREQTPAVDPASGQPIVDALGRPLDTQGQPIVAGQGPRCLQTQHNAVLEGIRAWNRSQEAARQENAARDVADRAPGFALAREPDLLIVADENGVVVARGGREMDNWFGPTRPNMNAFPVVALAELGQPQSGLIAWREYEAAASQLAHVGVAPIVVNGRFVGTVTLGYLIINENADEHRARNFGVDVAYFFRDSAGGAASFAATSFASRPAFRDAIAASEFFLQRSDGSAEATASTWAEVTTTGVGRVYRFEFGGDTWFATAGPLATGDDVSDVRAGYLVVAPASQLVSGVAAVRNVVPAVALVCVLIGVFGFAVMLRGYLRPIEEVSRGIQEVIAGNRDYMWPVDEANPFSDLNHSLNIMSARLQGKRDPDAEDDESGGEGWGGMVGGAPQARAAAPAGVAGVGNLRGRKPAGDDDSAAD